MFGTLNDTYVLRFNLVEIGKGAQRSTLNFEFNMLHTMYIHVMFLE